MKTSGWLGYVANHEVIQRKFIQAKDTAALHEYMNLT